MTVVTNLQLWADNLETTQLPEIESDISTLQVEVPALSALITQKAQQFSDNLAAYAVTVTSAAATALQADDRSDLALTEIYALKQALETYTDSAVAGVQSSLDTSVADLSSQLATQVLDDTATAVAAEIAGVLSDTAALAATATAMLTSAEDKHNDILAGIDLLTDVTVPTLSVLVDSQGTIINTLGLDYAAITANYPHATLLEGIDAAQAKNEADLAPLAGSILRIPRNLWGRDLETASDVLEKPTLNTYGTFHVDDADFGECFEFGDSSNTNVGPAYPIDFDNNRVYKITATFKVITANTWVHFGVTTQKGTSLVEGYNAKSITGSALTAGTVHTATIYVGSDATALGNYGLSADEYIVLANSSTANKLYWFVEQNLTPGSGHIKLASLFITDVTEVLSNINALRTELQSNIDGVSATLTNDYYTAVETDSAIAVSAVSLQSNIDGVQANLNTEASTRASEDTAIAADIVTLTAEVDSNTADVATNTADVAANTADVATNTAGLAAELIARANADSAIAGSVTALNVEVDTNTAGLAAELIARADADTAISASVTTLTTEVDANTSGLATELVTRADADSALSVSITNLNAEVDTNTVGLAAELVARANADSAIAADLTTLTATVGGVSSNLSANYYTSAQTNSAITGSATTLQASINAVSSTLSTDYYTSVETDSAISVASTALQSNIDGVSSNLSTNYYTIAQADTAIAAAETSLQSNIDGVSSNLSTNYYTSTATDGEISTAISTAQTALQSDIDDVVADLVTESTTRTNADSAISTTVTNLTATVGTNTSSISTQAAAITDIEGNMTASLAFRAKSGTAGAELELIALDDASGSVSAARISADDIVLNGSVHAAHINVSQLDTIAADVGTITAGELKSSDNKFVIDLNNKTISIET